MEGDKRLNIEISSSQNESLDILKIEANIEGVSN